MYDKKFAGALNMIVIIKSAIVYQAFFNSPFKGATDDYSLNTFVGT